MIGIALSISCVLVRLVIPVCGHKLNAEPEVTLEDGSRLRGSTFLTQHRSVVEFLGIPYGKPPVGELRFAKPVPAEPWEGVRNSTMGFSCRQTPDTTFGKFEGSSMWNAETELSEDCLHLNIWTANLAPKRPLPVLFWIFGGGFYSGSNTLDLYDGKILSSTQHAVVVSISYRVNAFGFLYLGTEDVAGNQGLWDQHLALRWVKRNILFFGGDPNRVTIFGESAGASSVDFQALFPGNQGLFENAILQSGSAIAPWGLATKEEALERALLLATKVGCFNGTQSAAGIADCLKSADPVEITKNEFVVTGFLVFTFTPIVDGHFLPEHPLKMLESGKFLHDVNFMYGNNHEEANFFIVYNLTDIYKNEELLKSGKSEFIFSNSVFESGALELIPSQHHAYNTSLAAILHEYRPYQPPASPHKYQRALDRIAGDFQFTCPVLRAADWRAKHGQTVFMYHFDHRSSVMPWPEWMGVLHGYEIPYAFGEPLRTDKNYTIKEQALAKTWMDYYGNFARTGNPNGKSLAVWPSYTFEEKQIFVLNTKAEDQVLSGYAQKQCDLWYNILPLMEKTIDSLKN